MTQDDTQKRGPGRPKEDKTIAARVLRDYWPTEDQNDRVRKGAIIEVTAEQMIDGMEIGTLERVKDDQ